MPEPMISGTTRPAASRWKTGRAPSRGSPSCPRSGLPCAVTAHDGRFRTRKVPRILILELMGGKAGRGVCERKPEIWRLTDSSLSRAADAVAHHAEARAGLLQSRAAKSDDAHRGLGAEPEPLRDAHDLGVLPLPLVASLRVSLYKFTSRRCGPTRTS